MKRTLSNRSVWLGRSSRCVFYGALVNALLAGSPARAVAQAVDQTDAAGPRDDLRATSRLSLGALIDLNDGKPIVVAGVGGATGMGPAPTMSLKTAAELAYERSYSIQAANAGATMAGAQREAAFSAMLPQVTGRYATGIEISSPASIIDTRTGQVVAVDKHHRRDLLLTVAQPLLDWQAMAAIARAQHVQEAAGYAAQDARDEEGLQIVQAYFGVIQATLGYKLLQDHVDRLTKLQRYMADRVAGGGASAADGQQVDGRVLAVRSLLEQQRAARDQAAITFEQLTGRRPGVVAIPSDMADSAPASLQEALERADHVNPVLAGLYANERAARSERSAAWGALLPRLSVELTKSGVENAGGDPGWRRDRRAMAVATWALNPYGANQNARVAEAKSRQYYYQRLDQRRTIEQALRVVFSALGTVRVRLDTARRELAANTEVVRSFDEQFTAGRKSLLELLDAYERLYQSRQTMLTVGVSGTQLHFQTLRVMGELSPTLAGAKAENL